MPDPSPTVVGLGEALFDLFDTGPKLGGAPLNVAVHAHQLLQPHGGAGAVASRVGNDELGHKVKHELTQRGMTTAHLQTDPDRPTGTVEVERTDDGGHTFHIKHNAAWDHLAWTDDLESLAPSCAAVAFGSLAQRSPTSRATIQRFIDTATNAIKLFDVNLRRSDGTDFYDADSITAGCAAADFVKLNDEELDTVCNLTGTKDAYDLRKCFSLRGVVFTRGKDGTAAFTADGFVEGQPCQMDRDDDADTVGAGDACSAGFLAALVCGADLTTALSVSNLTGAYVASKPGATPTFPDSLHERVNALLTT